MTWGTTPAAHDLAVRQILREVAAQDDYREYNRVEFADRRLTKFTTYGLTGELPPELGQLQHLTNLHLSLHQLTVLPPKIGQLHNPTHLELEYNQLDALAPEFGQLTNLSYLDLRGSPWPDGRTAIWRDQGFRIWSRESLPFCTD